MSRFGGKLVLVLLDNKRQPSIRRGRSLWGLQRELTYQTGDDPAEIITVPAGFVTDLASIPRVVWSFFPPDGPWVKGAVIHDFRGAEKQRLRANDLLNRFEDVRRADQLDESAADMLRRLYV